VPNINEAFPSKYLSAADLQGSQVVVTIHNVTFEEVGIKRDQKPVVYFVGKRKGLVLNKTNARKITEVTGSALTEEWIGHAIVLYPTETEYQGDTVETIRVKPVTKAVMGRMTPTPAPSTPQPPPVDNHQEHAAPLTDDDIPF
jgi:hypothetical protein